MQPEITQALSLQQVLPLYLAEEKWRAEWQSREKVEESTEGMNRGSTGKEGELLGGVKRGREKQQQSVHQLLRAETVCWHSMCTCLWKREGEVKGGREDCWRGQWVWDRPSLLVASCSTSGDLYVNLTAFCQRAFVTYFILSRFFARGLKRLHC